MLLIFRKKREGRLSIEKVFEPLLPYYKKVELPCELTGVRSFIKIFLFLLKIQEKEIHVTGDVHYVIFLLFWKKSILTIHDLNNYENLKGIRKRIYGIIWFKLPLFFANKVTVISPYTKEQLTNHFKIDHRKIRTVTNSFKEIPKLNSISGNKSFKILAIGTKKNKNLNRLFKAVEELDNVELLIVGSLSNELTKSLNNKGIRFQNFFNLSEEELAFIYNLANMLYFVSIKEGFGLPILEAQSIGLPVLTATKTSMPFVAGKGALLVDPNDVCEIRAGIIELRDNYNLRKRIIKFGFENIRRFSPEIFIENFIKIYSSFK